MSAQTGEPSLDHLEQVARLERVQAETRKFSAEQNKLAEEASEFQREANKLLQEESKLAQEERAVARDQTLAPLLFVFGLLTSVVGGVIGAALNHLLR